VLTGADVMALTSSLVVGVKAPLECWPIAVDRVRYVGEPVAIVVASDRYRAEDAVDLIEMRYRPLPAVVDPVAAATADSPLLHPAINSNVVGERTFRYGDPERAFAEAAHRVRVDVRYPRNSCTPIETYGIVAEYDAGEDAYDVLANFQGPFSLHPVMARALKVPGNRSLLHRLTTVGRRPFAANNNPSMRCPSLLPLRDLIEVALVGEARVVGFFVGSVVGHGRIRAEPNTRNGATR
jgi:2-furoyl-CoA dehydrogenase large subunit